MNALSHRLASDLNCVQVDWCDIKLWRTVEEEPLIPVQFKGLSRLVPKILLHSLVCYSLETVYNPYASAPSLGFPSLAVFTKNCFIEIKSRSGLLGLATSTICPVSCDTGISSTCEHYCLRVVLYLEKL
jgi:hypothetical protein